MNTQQNGVVDRDVPGAHPERAGELRLSFREEAATWLPDFFRSNGREASSSLTGTVVHTAWANDAG